MSGEVIIVPRSFKLLDELDGAVFIRSLARGARTHAACARAHQMPITARVRAARARAR